MRTKVLCFGVIGVLWLAACGLDTGGTGTFVDGGAGAPTGGSALGGSGGQDMITGGTSTGAAPAGGSATGGSATGGSATGGSATGGSATGGGGTTGGTGTGGTVSTCGDGVIQTAETCDPGGSGAVPGCNACQLDAAFLATVNEASVTDASGRVHYYFLETSLLGFEAAQASCQAIGGNLATIRSADEQTAVATVGAAQAEFWIGARDPSDTSAGLTWVDTETETGYRPSGGVSLSSATELCVVFEPPDSDSWHDRTCTTADPSVCEWIVPGTPG